GGRAVPERTGRVPAPAIRRMVRGDAAAVQTAHTHFDETEPARNRRGREPLGERAGPELTFHVGTPAKGRVVRGQAAGVLGGAGHAGERQAPADRRGG